ncbi:hypothetical protein AKG38_18920 [Pectobacterium carotovorum subsp. carotovorum]|nr:hypothetical protein [Pectobacterium carotovorum subsp. carotovorum]TAI93370.1 hypothetical protein EG335_20410 [Pectobacterium versatile]TAI97173.1 hypothetical protein EG332_11135 [Pectobacterium versatile]
MLIFGLVNISLKIIILLIYWIGKYSHIMIVFFRKGCFLPFMVFYSCAKILSSEVLRISIFDSVTKLSEIFAALGEIIPNPVRDGILSYIKK